MLLPIWILSQVLPLCKMVTAVPTLSQWSLMLMALLLGGVGMRRWRGGGA